MKLYYHPQSHYSMKVRVAIEEKKLKIPSEIVPLQIPEKKAQYMERYYMGKVPLLEFDKGVLIPESSIIVEALDDYSPRMVPLDRKTALHVRLIDRMIDHYLTDPLIKIHFERNKEQSEQRKEFIELETRKIKGTLTWLEKNMQKPWLAGNDFSLADCSALAPLYFAQNELELSAWPDLQVYTVKLIQRPSCKIVLDELIRSFASTSVA